MWNRLATTFALSLSVLSLNVGLASNSLAQNARANFDAIKAQTSRESISVRVLYIPNPLVQIPYTLNQNEVQDAIEIRSDGIATPADLSGVAGVRVMNNHFTSVYVFNEKNNILAKDVVAPEIKMSLEFNAESSARAQILEAFAVTTLSFEELKGLFDDIDDHERFPELVAMFRQDLQARKASEIFGLALLIANDFAIERPTRKD